MTLDDLESYLSLFLSVFLLPGMTLQLNYLHFQCFQGNLSLDAETQEFVWSTRHSNSFSCHPYESVAF